MIVFVDTLVPIYVARFILGISVGMVYAVVPMYVGEISEVSRDACRPHSSLAHLPDDVESICVLRGAPRDFRLWSAQLNTNLHEISIINFF
jgi:hypothetical protein